MKVWQILQELQYADPLADVRLEIEGRYCEVAAVELCCGHDYGTGSVFLIGADVTDGGVQWEIVEEVVGVES